MAVDEQSSISWRDGSVPVSLRFDDPYFSLHDGLAETRHVFLAGNGLPARLTPGFQVAELGFGTGLNLLATLLAAPECAFGYTSFEAYPLHPADIARALDHFPEARAIADPLLAHLLAGDCQFTLGAACVTIVHGDARGTLPLWPGMADAWFLDGFSPAKNPELWSPALMAEVARHTNPQGTFATYTAAGHVRRALAEAGFTVSRLPGHGQKRHMSAGYLA